MAAVSTDYSTEYFVKVYKINNFINIVRTHIISPVAYYWALKFRNFQKFHGYIELEIKAVAIFKQDSIQINFKLNSYTFYIDENIKIQIKILTISPKPPTKFQTPSELRDFGQFEIDSE